MKCGSFLVSRVMWLQRNGVTDVDLIRHRMLLNSFAGVEIAPETINVYDYATAPNTINGEVLSGGYTELGKAGLKMLIQGGGTQNCVIGTYNLTKYAMLKVVGAKKDFNITELEVRVLNAESGQALGVLNLVSILGSNDTSTFTVANGNYTTHYLSLAGITGECVLEIRFAASGTTQFNVAAFSNISLIPGATSDPSIDRIVIEGTGDASIGWVKIDETKYTSDTVIDLAAGNHSFEGHAYSITYYGEEHHAPSFSSTIGWSNVFTGSAKITITQTSTGGIFGDTYYSITIDGGE